MVKRFRKQLGQGGAAPGTTNSRQTDGNRDDTASATIGGPKTRPSPVSATPGVVESTPSSEGGEITIARGRRGQLKRSDRRSRTTNAGRGADSGRGRSPTPGASAPPSSAAREVDEGGRGGKPSREGKNCNGSEAPGAGGMRTG